MIVNPKEKIQNRFFYNNLMFIMAIFCVVCFITYFNIESKVVAKKNYTIQEGSIYGPIVVKKGQSKICRIESSMFGDNTSVYFTGEVLDEDKEISLEEARNIKKSYSIGDTITTEESTKDFGRIAAQTAKQVVMQKLREIERQIAVSELSEKED